MMVFEFVAGLVPRVLVTMSCKLVVLMNVWHLAALIMMNGGMGRLVLVSWIRPVFPLFSCVRLPTGL